MSNPFSVLDVDNTEDTSTNNPQRKLNKLKRLNEKKPCEERTKIILEMEERLNPVINKNINKKKTNKKKIKKKQQQQGKNDRKYQEREKRRQESKIKKEEEEKEYNDKKKVDEENMRKKQEEREKIRESNEEQEKEPKTQEEIEEEQRDREIEQEALKSSFKLSKKEKSLLPQDIRKFISKPNKKMYSILSKKYHPDKGGSQEHFQIINNYMNKK
tara:strand:- start:1197 stop:1841 length:645 start_codon:yes stop_codon:yes gene_type:complete